MFFVVHCSIPSIVIVPPSFQLAICRAIDSYFLVRWSFDRSGVLWLYIRSLFYLQRNICVRCFLGVHYYTRILPLAGAASNGHTDSWRRPRGIVPKWNLFVQFVSRVRDTVGPRGFSLCNPAVTRAQWQLFASWQYTIWHRAWPVVCGVACISLSCCFNRQPPSSHPPHLPLCKAPIIRMSDILWLKK